MVIRYMSLSLSLDVIYMRYNLPIDHSTYLHASNVHLNMIIVPIIDNVDLDIQGLKYQ